jgi:hypothetical protein
VTSKSAVGGLPKAMPGTFQIGISRTYGWSFDEYSSTTSDPSGLKNDANNDLGRCFGMPTWLRYSLKMSRAS